MKPETLQRLAQWLSKLEPEMFAYVDQLVTGEPLQDGWKLLSAHLMPDDKPVMGLSYQTEQGRLFEACFHCVDARGWGFQFEKPFSKPERIDAYIRMNFRFGGLLHVRIETNDFGIAAAKALIETREPNWETRTPEVST